MGPLYMKSSFGWTDIIIQGNKKPFKKNKKNNNSDI